jgi:hypothetical protein
MEGRSFKVPPHWEQCSISISDTRCKGSPGFRASGRRSPFKTAPGGFVNSRAQLIRVGAEGGRGGSWSAEGVLALTVRWKGTLPAWRPHVT